MTWWAWHQAGGRVQPGKQQPLSARLGLALPAGGEAAALAVGQDAAGVVEHDRDDGGLRGEAEQGGDRDEVAVAGGGIAGLFTQLLSRTGGRAR